jgi:hypothetical protein
MMGMWPSSLGQRPKSISNVGLFATWRSGLIWTGSSNSSLSPGERASGNRMWRPSNAQFSISSERGDDMMLRMLKMLKRFCAGIRQLNPLEVFDREIR